MTGYASQRSCVCRLCCKNDEANEMGMRVVPLFSLGTYPKECGNQCDLTSHISFFDILYLSFPDHVHHLEPLECLPACLEREKAHSWLGQPFDEPMVLLHQITPILDLS